MDCPFYLIESSKLFETIQKDSAQEFIIRIQFYPEEILLTDTNIISALNFKNIVAFVSTNKTFSESDKIFEKLFLNLKENSNLINYLLLLNYVDDKEHNFKFYDIMDIIKLDGKNIYKELKLEERLKIIKEHINSTETLIVKNEEDYFCIQNPIYKICQKSSVPIIVAKIIEEYNDLYYRINIYGNNNYTFFNPYLKEIQEKTGFDLRNIKNMEYKEYQNHNMILTQF